MLRLNDLPDIVKLIYLVKHRPAIYDNTISEHSCRVTVDNCWKEVADEMNASPDDCKRKWGSLRNAFSRQLRNEKEPDINQSKKKKWYLAEHLSFLRNFHHTRTSFKVKFQRGSIQSDDSVTQDCDLSMDMDDNKSFFDFSFQDQPNKNHEKKEIEDEEDDDVIMLDDDIPSPVGQRAESMHASIDAHKRTASPRGTVISTMPPQATGTAIFQPHNASTSVLPQSATPAILPTHTAAMPILPSQSSAMQVPSPHSNVKAIPPTHTTAMSTPTSQSPAMPVQPPHVTAATMRISSPQSFALSIPTQIDGFNSFATQNPNQTNSNEIREPSHMNGTNNTRLENSRRSGEDDSSALDKRNMTFFMSLIPDILTLNDKRQRLYKANVLRRLNDYLDANEVIS